MKDMFSELQSILSDLQAAGVPADRVEKLGRDLQQTMDGINQLRHAAIYAMAGHAMVIAKDEWPDGVATRVRGCMVGVDEASGTPVILLEGSREIVPLNDFDLANLLRILKDSGGLVTMR